MDLKMFHNSPNEPLDITPFVTANNSRLLTCDNKSFWVTPKIMFKHFFKHEFESYSEVFNKTLMPKMCLHNSCDYRIARMNNKTGVITERVSKENELFFTVFDIMKYYNFFNCSLPIVDGLIKRFCSDEGYIYVDEVKDELEKLYLYDLLTMQQDRGPMNFGIVIDQNNQVKIVYYDHGNMMFMPEDDLIAQFEEGSFTVQEFDEKYSSTMFLIDFSDASLWQQPKLKFIKSYLENSDDDQRDLFYGMLDNYTGETVQEIFDEMEEENKVTTPPLFERAIFEEVKYIQSGVHSLKLSKSQRSKRYN